MTAPSSSSRSSAAGKAATPSNDTLSGKTRKSKPGKPRGPVVPRSPGVARIIAIANQKGGVGKSTTAVSLGAALADIGYRVLVVDLDPQGNASTGMGIRHESRDITIYDVIVSESSLGDAVVETPIERLHAVPSTIDLAGAEIELVSQFSREGRLKRALAPVSQGKYDFILLDCPPSLGLLTVNALTAAQELIVPIQCEYYALEGLGQLLRNVDLVRRNINPGLQLSGIVMTMFDPRTKLSEQVVAEVQRFFGELMYDVIIPRTVRLSEAPGFGQPITVYDPRSRGAESYRQLAREVATRLPSDLPMPIVDELPGVVPTGGSPPDLVDLQSAPPQEAPLDADLPTVHDLLVEPEAAPSDEEVAEEELDAESVQADVGEAIEEVFADLEDEPSARSSGEVMGAGAGPGAADEDVWAEIAPEEEPRVRPAGPATGRGQEEHVVVIGAVTDQEPGGDQGPPGAADLSRTETDEPQQIGGTLHDERPQEKRRWRLFRKGGG